MSTLETGSHTALRDETLRLLKKKPSDLRLADIARDLKHLKVTESWLLKFGQGRIPNPRVLTICALNEYLKNKQQTNA